jgi:hypothetical protein
LDNAIAGCDLYSIEFVLRGRCQGFPDTLSRAAVFHTLVRDLVVARIRHAIVLIRVARALIAAVAGTTHQANQQR